MSMDPHDRMDPCDRMPAHEQMALHDLLSRYAWALSTGDVDGFVALFTPEGRIHDQGSGRQGQGPEGLRHFIHGALVKVLGMGRQYHVDHIEIRPDAHHPDRCRVRSFWQILRSADGQAKTYLIGHYDDVCVKHAGQWRFAERVASVWRREGQPWVGPEHAGYPAPCAP